MSIILFIDLLKQQAGYYTGLLKGQGLVAEYDDIFAEIGVAAIIALNKYEQGKGASLTTYIRACVKVKMKEYRRTLLPLPKMQLQVEVEAGFDVNLIIEEINETLSKQERQVFAYMLKGGKRPKTASYYNAVGKVRKTARKIMEL